MQAEQWYPDVQVAGVLDLRHATDIRRGSRRMAPGAYIETLVGPQTISPGDWIVTDADGVKSLHKSED